jgi:hypothetical protein
MLLKEVGGKGGSKGEALEQKTTAKGDVERERDIRRVPFMFFWINKWRLGMQCDPESLLRHALLSRDFS